MLIFMAFCPSGYAGNTNMNISTCTINKTFVFITRWQWRLAKKWKCLWLFLSPCCSAKPVWHYPAVETSLRGKGTLVYSGIVMKRAQGDGFFTSLPPLDYPQRSTAVSQETRKAQQTFSSMLPAPGSLRMPRTFHWYHMHRLMHKYYWNIHCTCHRTCQAILILTICFQEVKLQYNKFDKNISVDLDDMDEKAVVYELFHSIVREVRDEVSAGCMIACDCKFMYLVTSLLKVCFSVWAS